MIITAMTEFRYKNVQTMQNFRLMNKATMSEIRNKKFQTMC